MVEQALEVFVAVRRAVRRVLEEYPRTCIEPDPACRDKLLGKQGEARGAGVKASKVEPPAAPGSA